MLNRLFDFLRETPEIPNPSAPLPQIFYDELDAELSAEPPTLSDVILAELRTVESDLQVLQDAVQDVVTTYEETAADMILDMSFRLDELELQRQATRAAATEWAAKLRECREASESRLHELTAEMQTLSAHKDKLTALLQ